MRFLGTLNSALDIQFLSNLNETMGEMEAQSESFLPFQNLTSEMVGQPGFPIQ